MEKNMKLFENIKDFFFAAEDDDADYPDTPSHGESRNNSDHGNMNGGNNSGDREDVPGDNGNPANRRNKVVNIQTTAQLQVVLVKPSAFTDSIIADTTDSSIASIFSNSGRRTISLIFKIFF
jgi:cell division inhibitor SepF